MSKRNTSKRLQTAPGSRPAGAISFLMRRRTRTRLITLTAGVLGVVLGFTLVLASGGKPFAPKPAPSVSPAPPEPPPSPITLSKEYIYAGGRLVAVEEPPLPNSPPTVSISSPPAGATFVAPATIAISASAADPDGTVSKVDFYQGTTLIGTDTTAPFSFNWTGVGAGGYSLTVKATDDRGGTTTSGSVAVTVNNPAPTVSITSPITGTILNAPATIAISASASVGVGTISKVDFYQGTTLIGTALAAPFNFNWNNVGAGTYNLTATATASTGTVATSTPVAVTINALPSVSIIAPTASSVLTAPGTVGMAASASDSDGTVSKVDFYQGTTLIGTATSTPFNFNWTNVPAGSYSLTAKATDNRGAVTTSAAVGVTVNNPSPMVSITAPAAGSVFVAPATITINASASVAVGTISKVDFYQGATLIGTDTTAPFSFNWGSVAAGSYSLTAKATASTGTTATSAAVGVTVGSAPTVFITMPANGVQYVAPAFIAIAANASDSDGTISKVDFYQGTTLLGTATTSPYSFNWTSVGAGTYSLTAKATDNMGMTATSIPVNVTVNNPQPEVSMTLPVNGATYTTPAAIAMGANASVMAGTITKVEFFQGATLLGTATSSPYTFQWNLPSAGSYSLTAKATASTGTTRTSVPVNVTVNDPPGGMGTLRDGFTDSLKAIEGLELSPEVDHVAGDPGSNRSTYYADGESRTDSYVRATITRLESSGSIVGVVLRSSPSSAGYYHADYDAADGVWKIYSNQQGVETELGAWEDSLSTGDVRTVMFQAIGDSLTLFVDDISRITVRDSQIIAAGRTGITLSGATESTGFAVSNFETGPAATPPASFGHQVLQTVETLFTVMKCASGI